MVSLEDLKTGLSLVGLEPSEIATIAAVVPIGDDSIQVFYRTPDGQTKERLLGRGDEENISIATSESPWSFDGDAESFKLAAEAKRIDLAFLFDPMIHASDARDGVWCTLPLTGARRVADRPNGPGGRRCRRIDEEVAELIVRLAKENRSWGYDRIAGALANLGHKVSDQTVGNVLKRHGIPSAPEREKTTTWKEFIRSHMDVLAATDSFTTEVWTKGGLVTYYVLFFMHVATRKVYVAGLTPYPNEEWVT